ncbi:MAG: hypothetical protein U0168_14845 [Nannocystaceae bacterium]
MAMRQALSGHCSWNEQPTALAVPSSQTGELPSHALSLSAVHCTQCPASSPAL